MLEAARTIKEALPDVIPIQLNGGVAMGEATTMQGALPLLAAAGGQVYDAETGLWTGATPEMIQMLGTYATIYGDEGLGDVDLQLLQDGRDQLVRGVRQRRGRACSSRATTSGAR